MDRSDGSALFPLDPLLILPKDDRRILLCHLHQLFLRPFFRHMKMDALPAFFTEPCLHHIVILNIRLQHQFLRHKGRPSIILLDKAAQDRRPCIMGRRPQIKMLPSDHLAIPDKENLHDCVRTLHRHCQDILVLAVAAGDLLPLRHLIDTPDQVTVFNGRLELHIFCRFVHLLFQHFQHRRMVPVQKFQRVIDRPPVFLFADPALARRVALSDVVIQAGSLLACVPGQAAAAASQLIQLPDQFYRILHRAGAGKWPEIPGLVFFHRAGKKHPGIFLPQRHLDKRITLIILQHRVVFWPVLLDQVALQHKRLQLRIRHDILKPPYPLYHLLDLRTFIPAALKILPHPVLQADSFPYINNIIPLIMHDIDAWPPGQLFQFFFYIKYLIVHFISLSRLMTGVIPVLSYPVT